MGPQDGDSRRWRLASLDFLGDPDELRAQAEQALRREGNDLRHTDRFEGADDTNSIHVVVDAQHRVTDIGISPQWKRRIGVDGFASALFDGYTVAMREATESAVRTALMAEPENHQDVSVPRPRTSESELGDEEWLRRTWATLHDIKAELRLLDQAEEAARLDERTVSGPEGLVTLRLRGRSLVGVEADTRRIAFAAPDLLRFDALDAFRSAAVEN
ncbi:MAG TPA: hypothetical protein VFX60_15625 [Micromonospora sp.]|nr:hypothetical protein [Micromonospora sp.]